MTDDSNVTTGGINWELLKALNEAPDDMRHFGGTYRCCVCGREDKLFVASPGWAADPLSPKCETGGCEGFLLRVDPGVEPTAEPLSTVVPVDQRHLAD